MSNPRKDFALAKMRQALSDAEKAEQAYFKRRDEIRNRVRKSCLSRGSIYTPGMAATQEKEDVSLQQHASDYNWYMTKAQTFAAVATAEGN